MMIAACGIVCSECEAYKATQANDPAAIAKVAADWSKLFNADIKPDSVWCDGCMSDSDKKCGHCAECDVRSCANGKTIANCAECSDYGCEKITNFHKNVPCAKATLDGLRANG